MLLTFLRCVSWYRCLIVGLDFSHLGFYYYKLLLNSSMQILIHAVRMARILHIGQKVENFQAFGSGIERYQNERSVEKAQVRISYKLNERLKIL